MKFHLGENKNSLRIVKEEKNYDFNKGFRVNGLTPGKEYYYKIESAINGIKIESQVLSFQKIDRKKSINAKWAKNAIFYEIYVRSFYDSDNDGTGDLKGLESKLDYLKELGVDAIWLMPICDSPSLHGYDVIDYYKIEPDYGTMEDFESLMKSAHEKGIKIIMDLVLNHSSSENKWFKDFVIDENSKYKDFYTVSDEFDDTNESGPWDQTIWFKTGNKTFMSVFGDHMPDLNYRSPDTREEAKRIAAFWLNKGIDGFRLDASLHIDDKDPDVSHAWWKEFNEYVKRVNPEAFLVGEAWIFGNDEGIAPFFGDMDSSFNFPLKYSIERFVNGKKEDILGELLKARDGYRKNSGDFTDTTFLANHDTDRALSIFKNEKKAKFAASILFTLPGTPFIYFGDEIGQRGNNENSRSPMDWYTASTGAGMTNWLKSGALKPNDGISVEEEINNKNSFLNFYKDLIKIRKENQVFFNGNYKKINLQNSGLYGYEVYNEKDRFIVVHNYSDANIDIMESELGDKEMEELLFKRVKTDGKYLINDKETLIFRK